MSVVACNLAAFDRNFNKIMLEFKDLLVVV